MTTKEQLMCITLAVLETISECGEAPEGHLYAVLMNHGMDLRQFHAFMDFLRKSDLVKSSGCVATLTHKGEDVVAECKRVAAVQ